MPGALRALRVFTTCRHQHSHGNLLIAFWWNSNCIRDSAPKAANIMQVPHLCDTQSRPGAHPMPATLCQQPPCVGLAPLAHLSPIIVGSVHAPDVVHCPATLRRDHAVELVHHVEVKVALAALDAAPVVQLLRSTPGVLAEARPWHTALWLLERGTARKGQTTVNTFANAGGQTVLCWLGLGLVLWVCSASDNAVQCRMALAQHRCFEAMASKLEHDRHAGKAEAQHLRRHHHQCLDDIYTNGYQLQSRQQYCHL